MHPIIAGTAGHIDHGKTALVRALTGIDTDRLEEEKRRGISIDLGFAHLTLPSGLRLSFVDVPGHERFVKNMLAGVGGIDLVLLVVAADESLKPQTREHFDICRLLGIGKGMVVLTKSDLVDADILELVKLEVEEFVRGSFLEGAPVMAVSSTTGAGIPELLDQLERVARTVAPRDASRYFRLPIDRAFTLRGFGTVVTGTLVAGTVAVEQEVELHPGSRRLRVRGVQVHGQAVERAFAGQRTALNLAGIEPSELLRGMVLAEAGRFRPTRQVDGVFDLLDSARPLKHRAPVHFHAGTAEIEAEVRILEGGEAVQPGARAYVRFLLREPLLILPGDRFIVRRFSPVTTIGGGQAIDIDAPRRARDPARWQTLARGSAAARLALLVRESGAGVPLGELAARTGLTAAEIEAAKTPGVVLIEGHAVDAGWLGEATARVQNALAEFHRAHPLVKGMPKEALRGRELAGAPAFLFDALLARSGLFAAEGELVRLASHSLKFKEDEQQALGKIEQAFEAAGLAVPALQEVLAGCGVEPARARSLLQILLKDKRLVRVSEDLVYHSQALARLRGMLAAHKGERFAVPQFKEWTGITRKYAIPLLEYLDREKVTLRQGDLRLVL